MADDAARRLTPETVVGRSGDQVSCRIDDETVLMHLETGAYFGYDPVGTRVWELLREPIAISALCERLTGEYTDVDVGRCTEDVVAFLEQLVNEGLVSVSGPEVDRATSDQP